MIDSRPVLTLSVMTKTAQPESDVGWVFHQRAAHFVGPLAATYGCISAPVIHPGTCDSVKGWLERYNRVGRVVLFFHGQGTEEGKVRVGGRELYPDEATYPHPMTTHRF